MTDNNIPEDIVPRLGGRERLFNLDRLAAQIHGARTATIHEPGKVIENTAGEMIGMEAPPPPVTGGLVRGITVTQAELRAADIQPRHVPNLRVLDTDTGEWIQ